MRIYILLLALLPVVIGGYLPPENGNYDNNESYRSCSCDDQIASLSSRVDRMERQNREYLQRRKRAAEGVIAFTAYLSHYAYRLTIGQPIVYDQTLVNEGQAYDTTTGKFTAPVDGLYMFSLIIETKHNVDTAVQLVVDGTNYLDAVVEPRVSEQNLQGGNVGVMKLSAGQEVWVKVYNSNGQSLEGGDTYRFTTFTGVLLAEMEFPPSVSVGK